MGRTHDSNRHRPNGSTMTEPTRVKKIAGARNLRDLGGYMTDDGRRVRWRMVYRAGHPAGIPAPAHTDVAALGLACIVDLRTTRERLHESYHPRLLENLEYWCRDYDYSDAEIERMLSDPGWSVEDARDLMRRLYRKLPYEQADGLRAMFERLRAGRVPLLINCSAGKDRTGTAAALLLSTLRVPRATIVADFILSEQLHDTADSLRAIDPTGPLAFMRNVSLEIIRALTGSPAEYIEEMFVTIEAQHGSVAGYCRDVLGLDAEGVEELSQRLLEPMRSRMSALVWI